MNENSKNPRVSIGIPVYNGEKYLSKALDSILAQTFTDLEVIISDNASADKTEGISRSYTAKDSRVRYLRNDANKGAAYNFNRVFELSKGEYFKWAAHDDVIAPDLIEKCVRVLQDDGSVVLCHSRVKIINERGEETGESPVRLIKEGSQKPNKRFGSIILSDRFCHEIFGLIRSGALKKTKLMENFIASDRVLRAKLSLLGRFYEVPQYLFFLRDHSERSVRAMPSHHLRGAWFDTSAKNKTVFPHWRIFGEYFKCIKDSSLKGGEKISCYLYLLRWLVKDLNFLRMAADLLIAIMPNLWQPLYGIQERFNRQ